MHRLFLSWFTGVTAVSILVAISFVLCVDPYNLYGLIQLEGVNAIKPQVSRHIEEIKLSQALKLNPDTLIMGNSRAEIGFDPLSPALLRRGFSAYNLSIRGTSIEVSNRELDYLLLKGIKPKRIILGLEFVDFLLTSQSVPEHEIQPRKPIEFPNDRWFWRFDNLFSMESLKDSFVTLFIQHDQEAKTMTGRGFNPLQEYEPIARNEGYYVLFQQRAVEGAKKYLKMSPDILDVSQFEILHNLLETAVKNDIDVTLVIYPYHAQILALFEAVGLMDNFVTWKRQLIDEVSIFQKNKDQPNLHLIDFSGYGNYQCEIVPPKGDIQHKTLWYWEGGHFKKSLGDIVMERILAISTVNQTENIRQNIFGVVLNQENFSLNLERMQTEKINCEQNNPVIFEEAKATIRSLAK